MTPTKRKIFKMAGAALAAALNATPQANAASGSWNVDASGNWSAGSNWTGSTVPGTSAGDVVGLNYDIAGTGKTVTVDTAVRVGVLNIGDPNGTNSYTLSGTTGGSFAFDNGGSGAYLNQVSTTQNATINNSLTLSLDDNLTINNQSSGRLNLNGAITDGVNGAKSVTVSSSGSGELYLTGTNTFGGGMTINSGKVVINSAGNVFGAGAITMNGGSIAPSGATSRTISNGITLGGVGSFGADVGGSITVAGAISGTGSLVKTGTNGLILQGTNSFTGGIAVNSGTLQLEAASVLQGVNTVQINSGAVFNIKGSQTLAGLNDNAGSGGSIANSSGGGKTLTLAGGGVYSFNGSFTSGGSNKIGLLISGSATQVLGGNNTVNTGYQSVTGSGGTLVFSKQNSIFQGLSAGAVVNANNPANAGISVLSGGAVVLGVGDSASGYFDSTAIGTFLDATHMGLSTNTTGFRNNSIFGFDTTNATAGTFTYSGTLANIGTSTGIGFAKLGAGTLVLDGTSTYGGGTQVRAGTLQVGAGGTTGNLGSNGDIAISSGAVLAINRSNAMTIGNKITGAGSFSQNGDGATTLTASTSDFSGGININGGSVVARVGSIGSGDVNLNSGAKQFKFNNTDFSISNNINIASGVVGTANAGLIDTDTGIDGVLNGSVSINGTPANGGHFGSSSSGSITVNGVITSSVPVNFRRGVGIFSGGGTGYTALQVRSGTAKAGANNGIATTAAVAIGGDGAAVLDLAGYNQSLVGITKGANDATITNSGATDSSLTTTGTSTFAGVIQDGVTNKIALTVSSGRLTLSGTNTYTGATSVSAGGLLVNGVTSASSAVSVASGARVGGTGTIGGSLSLDNGAKFVLDLAGPLTVTGAVSLDNSFSIASLVTSTGGAIDWTLVAEGTYTLIANSSSFSNIQNFGLANAADIGGGRSAYFEQGSLQLIVVPEPNTFVMLISGLGLLVGMQRARRRIG